MPTNVFFINLVLLFTCLVCCNGIDTGKGKQKKYLLRNEATTAEPLFNFRIKETFQSDEGNMVPVERGFDDENLGLENYNYGEEDLLLDKPRYNFPFKEQPNYLNFIGKYKFPNNPQVSGFSDDEDDDGYGLIIKIQTTTLSREETISQKNFSQTAKSIMSNVSVETEELVVATERKNLNLVHENIVPLRNSNYLNNSEELSSFLPFKDMHQQHGNITQIAILNSSTLESILTDQHQIIGTTNRNETDLKRGIKNRTQQNDTSNQNETDLKRRIKNRMSQNETSNDIDLKRRIKNRTHQNDTDLKRQIKYRTQQNDKGNQNETDLKRGIKYGTHHNVPENFLLAKGLPPIIVVNGAQMNLVWNTLFFICIFLLIII